MPTGAARPRAREPRACSTRCSRSSSLIVLLALTIALFGTDATGGPLQVALLHERRVRRPGRVQERPHGRRGPRRRGRRRLVGDGRDLHPARRRRADRHLEHGRHDPDGRLLRHRAPQPDLVLPQRRRVICGLVGLVIGSSWTTAATLGVAFVALAPLLGLDPAITAGAVISGAYFGDKMTPLSETTVLVPSLVGGVTTSASTSAR